MIERIENLQVGDECPYCGNEKYGDLNAICRAKAGNLMCRYCGNTFDSHSNKAVAKADVSEE